MTNFKILVWSKNYHETVEVFGLENVILIGQISVKYTGGKASFYFYAKVPVPDSESEVEVEEEQQQQHPQ